MAREIKIPVSAVSRPGKKKKSPPILSHEFIQENHADIVSLVCMLIVCGLVLEMTRSLFTPFVAPQHLVNNTIDGNDSNSTNYTVPLAGDEYEEEEEIFVAGPNNTKAPPPVRRFKVPHYSVGPLDCCTTFFYTMVWIVMHAVCKEYLWDRFLKPLRLSKAKTNVYFQSCNFVTYYLVAAIWAFYVAGKEKLLSDVDLLWRDYPHIHMTFRMKIFLLIQIGYWLHNIPELYFLRAKKDDIIPQLQAYVVNVLPLILLYVLHFHRIGVVLLAFHATGEFLKHLYILLGLWRESAASKIVPFRVLIFAVVRIFSVVLAVVVFGVGLAKEKSLDLKVGNYNTLTVRMSILAGVIIAQLWLVWEFTTEQLAAIRERRERNEIQSKLDRPAERRQRQKKETVAAEAENQEDEEEGGQEREEEAAPRSPARKETQPRRRAAAAESSRKSKH